MSCIFFVDGGKVPLPLVAELAEVEEGFRVRSIVKKDIISSSLLN